MVGKDCGVSESGGLSSKAMVSKQERSKVVDKDSEVSEKGVLSSESNRCASKNAAKWSVETVSSM